MKKDYSVAIEKRDFSRIDKIYKILDEKDTNKNNYYDKIRKITKKITSCHSLNRWQILAEYFEKYVKE